MKWKKGQMSLEMIIGMVILLVVAAVIITLFTNVFESPDQGSQRVEESEIQRQCQNLCSNWKNAEGESNVLSAAWRYCAETYNFDEDGNDVTTAESVENGYNSYCQDNTHCFNVHTCQRGRQLLDARECVDVMRDYYENIQGDSPSEANTRIETLAEDSNSCDIATFEGPAGEQRTWIQDWLDAGSSP